MTAKPIPAPPPPRMLYTEFWGHLQNEVFWSRIIACFLLVVVGAMTVDRIRTQRFYSSWRPAIIRIDEFGSPAIMPPTSYTYTPHEGEVKYFLTMFVQNFYSRRKATIQRDWPESLYFLNDPIAKQLKAQAVQEKLITRVLSGEYPEVEITVKHITLTNLQTMPYTAIVEYERAYLGPSGDVVKRQRCTGTFAYGTANRVPDDVAQHNPLGFAIVDFREDKAFE